MLEQIFKLAASQRRLGFGSPIKIIRQFDSSLHRLLS
jgi:hypothetical protein